MVESPKITEHELFYYLDSEIRGQREVSGSQSTLARFNHLKGQLLGMRQAEAMKILDVMESIVSRGAGPNKDDLEAAKQKEAEKAELDAMLYQRKMRQQSAVQDMAVGKA